MTAQRIDQPNVPWCTRAQVVALPAYAALSGADTALLDAMCWVASTWLWRATGRQFSGPASTTVRPVGCYAGSIYAGYGALGPTSALANTFDSRTGTYGWWGRHGRREGAFEVLLGHTPVRSVDSVIIDGVLFDPAKYRLDDARWLVRTDGNAWPANQDWTKPAGLGGGVNTWEVSLTWGEDPPPDGVYAAEVLSGELALAATSMGECRLPRNVQSVTRQGTSMLMMDPTLLLTNNRWGLPEIDFFVHMANPAGLAQPATMTSPDIGRAVRRAGTLPGS